MLPLIPIIASAAPVLIKHFTGDDKKDAPLLEKTGEILKDVTGISNIKDAVQAVTGNKEAMEQFGLALMDKELEFEKLANEDRANARGMYEKTDHEEANKIAERIIKWNLPGVIIMLACDVLVYVYVADKAVALGLGNLIGLSINALWQERQQVISFFFGSSIGSKRKSEHMMKG